MLVAAGKGTVALQLLEDSKGNILDKVSLYESIFKAAEAVDNSEKATAAVMSLLAEVPNNLEYIQKL